MATKNRHFRVGQASHEFGIGSARAAVFMQVPAVLRELGLDPQDVLAEVGVGADLFNDPDNLIPYPVLGRLLSVCALQTNCDHIGLLVGQRSRLANMGLAGQVALCADTVGEGLQNFADYFSLHSTAATISVVTSGGFTRFVYAIVEHGMTDTGPLQLGAMAVAFNVLQDLCGPEWLPALVTVAGNEPSNLRPCHKFFRAPLRFDSDESAVVFESHWLGHPLPVLDSTSRRQIEAQVRAQRAAILDDFPTIIRHIMRKQLVQSDVSMEQVAARLGMHRRTLDRRLKRHGLVYSELIETVKSDVAFQLLRDTRLPMREIAASLHYSSAANFATAFRRWTGVTPSAYRRGAD
jgi:AraC-like DNA-binding protein